MFISRLSQLNGIAVATILTLTFSASAAQAQYSDPDPFGASEESDTDFGEEAAGALPPGAEGVLNAAGVGGSQGMGGPGVESLFGTGDPNAPKPYQNLPKPNPAWSDLSSETGERIEDTYEMKIREELNKPLPKRNPFGDRIKEIRGQYKSQNGNGIDFGSPRSSKGSRLKLE